MVVGILATLARHSREGDHMPVPTPFVESQMHHATTIRQLRERLAEERDRRLTAERKLDVLLAALARNPHVTDSLVKALMS